MWLYLPGSATCKSPYTPSPPPFLFKKYSIHFCTHLSQVKYKTKALMTFYTSNFPAFFLHWCTFVPLNVKSEVLCYEVNVYKLFITSFKSSGGRKQRAGKHFLSWHHVRAPAVDCLFSGRAEPTYPQLPNAHTSTSSQLLKDWLSHSLPAHGEAVCENVWLLELSGWFLGLHICSLSSWSQPDQHTTSPLLSSPSTYNYKPRTVYRTLSLLLCFPVCILSSFTSLA